MNEPVPDQKHRHYATTQEILIQVAGILTVIPLAPFLCRFIPPIMVGDWNIDLIIAVIASLIVVRFFTWLLRPMVLPGFILLMAVLTINQFSGRYSFSNVYNDYTSTVASNWSSREEKQVDLISLDPKAFVKQNRTTRKILTKIQYTDSTVRNFAVKHSVENFKEYSNKFDMRTRYLSLFKYINANFNYVPDSQRDEYFATAKETIQNGMGGDCDDHSILMASALASIGAKCRLLWWKDICILNYTPAIKMNLKFTSRRSSSFSKRRILTRSITMNTKVNTGSILIIQHVIPAGHT
jgi:hypothetical protein